VGSTQLLCPCGVVESIFGLSSLPADVCVINLPVLPGRSAAQTILIGHCVRDGVVGGAVSLMAGHRLPLPARLGATKVD
jgi:hypothetical protein